VPKAFIVPRGELTADEVVDFVQAQVAPYKRVRHVAFIDAIPKSAAGKTLRRILKHREVGR
jgi:acyl-coenzyme A synthetase/AMP-(fatty) acid ligase